MEDSFFNSMIWKIYKDNNNIKLLKQLEKDHLWLKSMEKDEDKKKMHDCNLHYIRKRIKDLTYG